MIFMVKEFYISLYQQEEMPPSLQPFTSEEITIARVAFYHDAGVVTTVKNTFNYRYKHF